MFATLLISLPSVHSGGELFIRFDGQEEKVDFSVAASNYKIPYTAFFADCEHEVKPVKSGYRVNLVYNLVQKSSTKKIGGQKLSSNAEKVQQALEPLFKELDHLPKAILLGHEYTPTNFSLGPLKHHDRPRALALMQAAEQMGYFAKLGLVTCYKMGALEGVYVDYGGYGRRNYYDDEEEEEEENLEDGTMGELYEEYIRVKNWGADNLPPLGDFNLDVNDIVSNIEVGEGDPTKKEAEGYTGNAGMTLEYWYHYGAVILWSKEKHFEMLLQTEAAVRMQWLNFYLENWENTELNAQKYTRQLVRGFSEKDFAARRYGESAIDYRPLAAALSAIKEPVFVKEHGATILVPAFQSISVEDWVTLIEAYEPSIFSSIFEQVAATKEVKIVHHLLKLLTALNDSKSKSIQAFVQSQIALLPAYIEEVNLPTLNMSKYYLTADKVQYIERRTDIVEKIIELSSHQESSKEWGLNMIGQLTTPLPRDYANQVLVPILQSKKYKDRLLANNLQEICLKDLMARTAVEPSPPANWTREIPASDSNYYKSNLDIIRAFMASPTQKSFDYRKKKSDRQALERAIGSVNIHLKMETIRGASPHTLRLTKTQTTYDLKHKQWKEDVAILRKFIKE